MRRSTIAILVLAASIGGGVVWTREHRPPTCPTRVNLHGVSYTPAEASEEIISGRDLGIGQARGCGWKGPYAVDIGLNVIPGVDPRIAVASSTSAYTVYLAPGVSPLDLPTRFDTVTLLGTH
jgi:hypothetical protein